MKNLLSVILIVLTGSLFGQPGKAVLDSVVLKNNELFNWSKGVATKRGGVFDAKGNFILGKDPVITGSSFNNLIGGNNVTINNASSIAALGTDCDFIFGSNYSAAGGDAHDIGGYSSTTFGFLNQNYIDGGTAIGTNIRLGLSTLNNRFTRSVGIGSLLTINNTDVYMFGKGDGSNQTQAGTFLVYGSNKLGLLPDGSILFNGVNYRLPSVQGQGYLYNDGSGNLSWQGTSVTRTPVSYRAYDQSGRLLFIQPVYKN